jgi:hypothetical protein
MLEKLEKNKYKPQDIIKKWIEGICIYNSVYFMPSIIFFLVFFSFLFQYYGASATIRIMGSPSVDLTHNTLKILESADWSLISTGSETNTTSDYEIFIEESEKQYKIRMQNTRSGASLFKMEVPSEMKKSAMENFESFLWKYTFTERLKKAVPLNSNSKAPLVKLNSRNFKEGDPIEIEFVSQEEGYVYIVLFSNNEINPILLYPNKSLPERKLQINEVVIVSDKNDPIVASPPFGKETIKIFSMKNPWTGIELKGIGNTKFHYILPLKSSSTKSAIGKSDANDFNESTNAAAEMSWEVMSK